MSRLFKKAHQRLRHQRVCAHSVRDDPDPVIRTPDLRDQQQVGDALRGCVNVDVGRHHGHEHGVGPARDLRERVRPEGRGRIHDYGRALAGIRSCQLRVTVAERSKPAMP